MNCPIVDRCKNFGTEYCNQSNNMLQCFLKDKVERVFVNSNLPTAYYEDKKLICNHEDPDFSTYIKLNQIQRNVNYYIHNGDNFYLYSEFKGNGKSAWSCKILREYIIKCFVGRTDVDTGYPLFIDMRRFVAEYRPYGYSQTPYVQNILNNVYDAPLIVWDDILSGNKETTQILDWLGSVLESRILNKKSNIYTSNTPWGDPNLPNIIGPALHSRMIRTSIPLAFKGMDRRSFN